MMQALFMQARLKNVSGMAAAKIAPAMDVITPFQESWASESTILAAVKTLSRMELIILRENLQKASNVTYRCYSGSQTLNQEGL
jgi:hypothetical protein